MIIFSFLILRKLSQQLAYFLTSRFPVRKARRIQIVFDTYVGLHSLVQCRKSSLGSSLLDIPLNRFHTENQRLIILIFTILLINAIKYTNILRDCIRHFAKRCIRIIRLSFFTIAIRIIRFLALQISVICLQYSFFLLAFFGFCLLFIYISLGIIQACDHRLQFLHHIGKLLRTRILRELCVLVHLSEQIHISRLDKQLGGNRPVDNIHEFCKIDNRCDRISRHKCRIIDCLYLRPLNTSGEYRGGRHQKRNRTKRIGHIQIQFIILQYRACQLIKEFPDLNLILTIHDIYGLNIHAVSQLAHFLFLLEMLC